MIGGVLEVLALHHRADIIHQHGSAWSWAVEPVARRRGLPWLVSLDTTEVTARVCESLVGAAAILVPDDTAARLAGLYGIPPQRIRVMSATIDLRYVPFRARTVDQAPPTVLFAGRLTLDSELHALIQSFVFAAEQTRFQCTVIIGDPVQARLALALRTAGLDVIEHDGSCTEELLLAADVVVSSGRQNEKPHPWTLQALASGAQLVLVGVPTSNLEGLATFIDPANLQGAAVDIARLLTDRTDWLEKSIAGRAHVALHHEIGSRAAEMEEIYAALPAGERLPAPRPSLESRPTVSVIIVTRDRSDLLQRALDSVLDQSYPADLVDVAVVDNGSKDGTPQILASRAGKEPRLLVVEPAPGHGVAEGRNRAVAATRGEILAFTDDDCVPTRTWLETLIACFHVGIDVVQGFTGPDPGQTLRPLSRTQFTGFEYGLYETCNIAYRRSAFNAVDGFDTGFADEIAGYLGSRFARYPFGEDTDLAWRAKRHGSSTRFSSSAVVHHHVFAPSKRLLLRRVWVGAAWPVLVARTPELRARFLTAGVFLGRRRVLFYLAAAGSLIAPLAPSAAPAAGLLATTAAPYVAHLLHPLRPGRRARMRAMSTWVLLDIHQTAALAYGSVRARSVVL